MIWCRSQGALTVLCALALLAAASCAPSENEIRRDVRAQFSANPEIARLELSVEVKGRVVYLSGKTATQDEQQQAVSLAQAVKGVKLVVNDMWLNNAALADKIKMALASDPMVGRIPIEGMTAASADERSNQPGGTGASCPDRVGRRGRPSGRGSNAVSVFHTRLLMNKNSKPDYNGQARLAPRLPRCLPTHFPGAR
jgi:hypothetical protein